MILPQILSMQGYANLVHMANIHISKIIEIDEYIYIIIVNRMMDMMLNNLK